MSTELVKREENLPAYLQTQTGPARGADGIDSNDVRPPRMAICQSMTPQRKRSDPKFIPGLEENQLFNDLTEEIYGSGPIKFTVIKFLGKRGIEFAPAEEGGGVVDFDVPLNDSRMQFTTDEETGKRVKPVATLFYDYLILLLHDDGRREPVAMSMKGTQIKIAKNLNSLIKLSGVDSFAQLFSVSVVEQRKDAYTFGNFKIDRVKVDGKPAFVDEDTYRYAEAVYKQFEGKNVVIERDSEREPGEDDGEEIPY